MPNANGILEGENGKVALMLHKECNHTGVVKHKKGMTSPLVIPFLYQCSIFYTYSFVKPTDFTFPLSRFPFSPLINHNSLGSELGQ